MTTASGPWSPSANVRADFVLSVISLMDIRSLLRFLKPALCKPGHQLVAAVESERVCKDVQTTKLFTDYLLNILGRCFKQMVPKSGIAMSLACDRAGIHPINMLLVIYQITNCMYCVQELCTTLLAIVRTFQGFHEPMPGELMQKRVL